MLNASRALAYPCPVCSSQITYSGRGRKRVYCSPACRAVAYSDPEHRAADAARKRWERERNAARGHFEAKYGGLPDREYGRFVLDAEDCRILARLRDLEPSRTGRELEHDGDELALASRDLENPGFDGSDLRVDDWRYGPLLRASRRKGYHVTLTKMAETDPALGWVSGQMAYDRKERELVPLSAIDTSRPEDFEARQATDGASDEWLASHYYDDANHI